MALKALWILISRVRRVHWEDLSTKRAPVSGAPVSEEPLSGFSSVLPVSARVIGRSGGALGGRVSPWSPSAVAMGATSISLEGWGRGTVCDEGAFGGTPPALLAAPPGFSASSQRWSGATEGSTTPTWVPSATNALS